MSEPGGQLFKENISMEPLFKTEQKEEELFQNQNQFLEQNQFMEATKEVSQQKTENLGESLADSFKEAKAEKIKADDGEPNEPEPSYVSLNYTGITITKSDNKKMKAVKNAVIKYQQSRGTDDEAPALDAVIKACNSYTWGKFSSFCFGKSKVKLNEVKKVREQAEKALSDLNIKKEQIADRYQKKQDEPEIEEKKVEEKEEEPRILGISADEIDEVVKARYKKMNAFQKMYHKLTGKYEIRNQVMQEWIKAFKFQNGIFDRESYKDSLSKNDSDYESTFL